MYRIGIDLGGTNIAVGVVNDRYEIVARRSVPTGAERPAEEVIRDMGDAVEEALRQAGLTAVDCASMGVGSPGACDPQTGVVKRAYNLNWFDVPVCRMLHQRFGIPVRLGNDANCAALAEVVAGAAVGCQDMVLITLGTGVGSGIISRGKILSGLRGGAGEAGHMLLVLDGEPCTCGRRGCWEAYASATALIRQTRQAALAHPESLLAQVEEITGRTAFDAAQQGDADAQNNLGVCCRNGIGVEKDQGKVLFWLKRAAAMGDRDAIQTLQKYYPKQTLVKTNDQLDEELPKEFVETTPGTIN